MVKKFSLSFISASCILGQKKIEEMPEVCRFFGIIIRMYINDHAPPHFHAYYQNFSAVFSIKTGQIIEGKFPQKESAFVTAWALLHGKELMSNWQSLIKGKGSNKINPLR